MTRRLPSKLSLPHPGSSVRLPHGSQPPCSTHRRPALSSSAPPRVAPLCPTPLRCTDDGFFIRYFSNQKRDRHKLAVEGFSGFVRMSQEMHKQFVNLAEALALTHGGVLKWLFAKAIDETITAYKVNVPSSSRGMEAWRKELQGAFNRALGFDEECDEFENEFFLQMVDVVSSELESEPSMRPQHRGSRVGREFVYHDKEVHHERMYKDYFSQNPTYGPDQFRRRYRMRREVFLHIVDVVT